MEKNHTKTANIQPTIASEPIGHILPCSSLDLETERTGKYAIPNDGYIPEQSNACSWPLWPFTVGIDHLLTHKFLHKIARTASNVCIEHNSGFHKPLLFSFFGIESPICREYLVNTAADLGGGCRGCTPPPGEMAGGFLIQLEFCPQKNYVVYWCWSRARDECTPS